MRQLKRQCAEAGLESALMVVLLVLLVSWLVFRGAGAAGVHAFASWQHSAFYALAVMFIFTASAHFN